jgi:peptide deformylase
MEEIMATMEVRTYGDPVLRQPTQPIEVFDQELHDLIEDMIDTMYAADGVGLAANQVGVSKRFAIFDLGFVAGTDEEEILVAINPRIIAQEGTQSGEEGCLSLPGVMAELERPARVTMRAVDANGEAFEIEAEGLLARAFVHELEHLDGKLFVDNLRSAVRNALLREYRAKTVS